MTRRGILISALFASLALTACGKEAPKEEAPLKKAPPPAQAPQPQAPAEPAVAEAAPDVKKRNPFQSFLILLKGVEAERRLKGPLECCEIDTFRVVAVVAGRDTSHALVQAPDGKRYIVRPGDVMGAREGRITKIDTSGISVREVTRDESGKVVSTADVELRLMSAEKKP